MEIMLGKITFNRLKCPGNMCFDCKWRDTQFFSYLIVRQLFCSRKKKNFALLIRKGKQCLLKQLNILRLLQFVGSIIKAPFANISQVFQGFPFISKLPDPAKTIIT